MYLFVQALVWRINTCSSAGHVDQQQFVSRATGHHVYRNHGIMENTAALHELYGTVDCGNMDNKYGA